MSLERDLRKQCKTGIKTMNKIPAIWGFVLLGGLVGAASALSTSSAETPSFLNVSSPPAASAGGTTATMRAQAEFVTPATYKVEHQPMTMGPDAATQTHIVTREAYVTIGGVPGETVLVSCNVSSTQNAHTNIRDCGGQQAVEQHAILSGQKLDDGVLLTDDLMPNDTGKSDSAVTFEVSYM
jgi:hypothetical protein